MEELHNYLVKFKKDLNENIRLRQFLVGWNINVILKVMDKDTVYTIIYRDGYILDILKSEQNFTKDFLLEANLSTFLEIFAGKLNPTEAVLDGELATYGENKDEDTLDAIALVIWGI